MTPYVRIYIPTINQSVNEKNVPPTPLVLELERAAKRQEMHRIGKQFP